ncbi:uncharacterized protein C8R40DRAFT_1074609 [Lentinula edodes]|uniref:uncharacterized protein n=1 Tax=Lentinula edodes TaxID=5353 RepID=UPI001E8D8256|nr:uncharacterized protein C8R40DRAFT_1074609 [Lentinula edodes]KAH7868734.1 hypothetical protein C8R40DRAFT_1074609 [Lentinula edodes]
MLLQALFLPPIICYTSGPIPYLYLKKSPSKFFVVRPEQSPFTEAKPSEFSPRVKSIRFLPNAAPENELDMLFHRSDPSLRRKLKRPAKIWNSSVKDSSRTEFAAAICQPGDNWLPLPVNPWREHSRLSKIYIRFIDHFKRLHFGVFDGSEYIRPIPHMSRPHARMSY